MRSSVFATKITKKCFIFPIQSFTFSHYVILNRNDTKVYGKSELDSDY